jgi:ribonuclease P protein component
MLSKPERLTRAGLFQRTHAAKKSVTVPPVSLFVLERQAKSAPRLPLVGFVIGKKVHGKAVQRNKAKRRVREAYRLLRQQWLSEGDSPEINIKQWYSLVFHIQLEAIEAPFQQIQQAVEQCLILAAKKYGRRSTQAKAHG